MTAAQNNSIIITGCGWVTPFALGSARDVLSSASSAIAQAPNDSTALRIPDDLLDRQIDLPKEVLREHDVRIAATALQLACQDAALDRETLSPERTGIILGCALAGQAGMIAFANEVRQQTARFVTPLHFPQTVGNYVAGALGRAFKVRGPNVTLSSGVASGLDAIVMAAQLLATHEIDAAFAGAFEALSQQLAHGESIRAIPSSEGACLFLLQRRRDVDAGGMAHRAIIGQNDQAVAGAPVPQTDDQFLSCAGFPCANAICVEHLIGRCGAAAGAATLAAAIGAAAGLPVPMSSPNDENTISTRAIDAVTGEPVPFLLLADSDAAHRTVLSATCPRS